MQELKLPKKNAFNFLRLICCLVVIYEHVVVLSEAEFPALFRGVAVNIFFILSGFWVTQSYLRSSSVKEYFLKRCKKILPQYLLVVIASAMLLSSFSVYSSSQYFFSKDFLKYLVANISTLNFIHPKLPGVFAGIGDSAVNGSLWTIKVEIGFYIILPLIMLLSKKQENANTGGGVQLYSNNHIIRSFCHIRSAYACFN